ncbi:KEOPS complex subunit Pcc1 [Methanohalophilus sp.]|uniref:KEOPS complex subunit Pcc1 n=1 Tax=Methanohalophilus sp. TaxID=1966352 RepID=UPI0026337CBB|nr:KEOPS complex subunit Pcc1 [Methanohalophilus sp.]MDK2892924.1 complex subunit Pcc1 [Methanohalophilus sp.]
MRVSVKSIFETNYAEKIYLTLLPELDRLVTDRSSISFKADNGLIILEVEADDLVSMRSTLNTWYRLVNVAYESCLIADAYKTSVTFYNKQPF